MILLDGDKANFLFWQWWTRNYF